MKARRQGGAGGSAMEARARPGLFARLRRDVRANTIAIMAIALIPISALTGSAVDMARMYVVKARLQQACDAGVLAGRKFLAASSSATIDDNASAQATAFFKNNFKPDTPASGSTPAASGWMNTTAVSFKPSKTADNQVAGTASATVPMTVMQMFGATPAVLNVACQARFDVADGDVMFVLDTTGSMACLTSDDNNTCNNYAVSNVVQNQDGSYSVTEKSNSRISGLRSAVLSFYDTIASYQKSNPALNFRYGFMPYSATTNVGALLPRSYMAPSTWTYQTRSYNGYTNNGSATTSSVSNVKKATCNNGLGPWTTTPATSSSATGSYTAVFTSNATWTASAQGSSTGTCTSTGQPVIAHFLYQAKTLDVSNFATIGTAVANPATTPVDNGVSSSTWNGCVEERGGSSTATSFSTSNPPLDLDVDTAPSSSNPASYWGPMWPDAEFSRQSTPEDSSVYRDKLTRYQFGASFGTYQLGAALNEIPCPKPAQRLTTMSRADVANYLSASTGFRPFGNTYHDAGMTWGTRLLSPTGMFASDTQPWPGHNAPNRYIIFLTDGQMETDEYAYSAHGMEQFDNRVGSNGNATTLTNIHNSRFMAACDIAKNHNIKIFVIGYAQALTTQLQYCASPGQAYYASDSASLTTAFNTIAAQVAMLRISQ